MFISVTRHLVAQMPSGYMRNTFFMNDAEYARYLNVSIEHVQNLPRYINMRIAYRFMNGRVKCITKRKWLKHYGT